MKHIFPPIKQTHRKLWLSFLMAVMMSGLFAGLLLAAEPNAKINDERSSEVSAINHLVAVTRLVDPRGTDTGSCITFHCATISYALSRAFSDDTISVGNGTYTESFTVDKSVRIVGSGATNTIVQAADAPNMATSRVMTVTTGVIVTIEGLTIRYGNTSDDGGGIYNRGTLAIISSMLSHNHATIKGGGIFNGGFLDISNSTLNGNRADDDGGGIYSLASVDISNSTLSGNSALDDGGAIYFGSSSLYIHNSTLSGNDATQGGGIRNSGGSVHLYNSIITNGSGGDCDFSSGVQSGSHNRIDDNSCTGNLGAVTNLDPTLADNGGDTLTHALLPGSNAIDVGDNNRAVDPDGAPLITDQRGAGFPRILNGTVDVGAFEHDVQCDFPITVTTEAELSNTIICYNGLTIPGVYSIILGADIDLMGLSRAINNSVDGVALRIEGSGFTIDGQGGIGVRPFTIAPDTTVSIVDLTITGGNVADNGGGIYNQGILDINNSALISNTATSGGGLYNEGTVEISNSALSDNKSSDDGGGIFNQSSRVMTVTTSILGNNHAAVNGGGIFNEGTLAIISSMLSHNHANPGGGIYNVGTLDISNSTLNDNNTDTNGGGIYTLSTANIINSTLSGNSALDDGGAIYSGSFLDMRNSTLSGNDATQGGGIMNEGNVYLYNSIVTTSSGRDCYGFNSFRGHHNRIDDNSCGGAGNLGAVTNLDPTLADNGSDTLTHALLPDSNAIDTGDNALAVNPDGIALTTDQRGTGFPRILNDTVDVGAVEFNDANTIYLPMIIR